MNPRASTQATSFDLSCIGLCLPRNRIMRLIKNNSKPSCDFEVGQNSFLAKSVLFTVLFERAVTGDQYSCPLRGYLKWLTMSGLFKGELQAPKPPRTRGPPST